MRIFIEPDRPWSGPVEHTWRIFARHSQLPVRIVKDPSEADRTHAVAGDLPLARWFFERLRSGPIPHQEAFVREPRIVDERGNPDLIATAFYMLNGLQEHSAAVFDDVGRFPYSASYQARFDVLEKDLVGACFDELARALDVGPPSRHPEPSRVFLSHDIDSVYGAYREDGFAALRQGRPAKTAQLILNAAVGRPDWLNMDRIMDLEDEQGMRSTFYWLVCRGRLNAREANADYDIHDPRVRRTIERIHERGWENGLHKSISPLSAREEVTRLGFVPAGNRYHYLKFRIPDAFRELEDAGIQLDSSLGFAECPGFRNSYASPFQPYDIEHDRPFSLVEVPLHVMDGTFHSYMRWSPDHARDWILDFVTRHRHGKVITILWHNTFFGDLKYRGYLAVYRAVLTHLRELGIRSITQRELIGTYTVSAASDAAMTGRSGRPGPLASGLGESPR